MAIVKNNFRVSRLEGELSPGSRDSMSSDEEEFQHRSSESESDDNVGDDEDDDDEDVDSGAGSDDFDISELGELGEEFCQVGKQCCSIPYELYDLQDLGEILSIDIWNDCLTEEERFGLSEYLPDMDQHTFMRTLKELFTGQNLHFGNPLVKLFSMLKGGLCEPRVALYRQGLIFFQKREHYHNLQKYQNSMVSTHVQIRDSWANCRGYSIEERLRVLNIRRSQRNLMYGSMEGLGVDTDSLEREESGEGLWAKRLKDVRVGSKLGPRAVHAVNPTMDVSSRGKAMAMEPVRYGQHNQKGILKVAGSKVPSAKELIGRFPSIRHGMGSKSRPYNSNLANPWHDDVEEPSYEMTLQRDLSAPRGSTMAKSKQGKKHGYLKSGDVFATDGFGSPLLKNDNLHYHVGNKNLNQRVDMEMLTGRQVGGRTSSDHSGKKTKHLDKLQRSAVDDQMYTAKDQSQHLLLKGIQVDWSAGSQPFLNNKMPVKFDDGKDRNKKRKMGQEFHTGKNNVNHIARGKSFKTFPPQMNAVSFPFAYEPLEDEIIRNNMQNGGLDMKEPGHMNMLSQSEETESDSSDRVDDKEYINPYKKKLGYGGPSASLPKKTNKLVRKDKNEYTQALMYLSRKDGDLNEQLQPKVESSSSKGKGKGKLIDPSYSRNNSTGFLQESDFSGSVKLADYDRMPIQKSVKNGRLLSEPSERIHLSSSKIFHTGKKKKAKVDHADSVPKEDDLLVTPRSVNDHTLTNKLGKKGQKTEAPVIEHLEKPDISLSGCKVTKKRKGKPGVTYMDGLDGSDYLHSGPNQETDDPSPYKRRGKRKGEAETGSLATTTITSKPLVPEREVADIELDAKPIKKPFTLITPTVHTGFSFSIIHLLSAVRMAMVTLLSDDALDFGRPLEKNDGREKPQTEEGVNGGPYHHENMDGKVSEQMAMSNLPSLTVQEIVSRVRSNPGDPCIIETQEPLQDLVRGVLKLYSSKTAPLGAKGWKTLVIYEKSTKSWSWIGPVSPTSDPDTVEEQTSSEAWGLPHKMLVKLVDSFANWLKSGQETLQQIGSLPAPPVALMQPNMDEKERFRDLRAQKSLSTISPSSEEVRAYFRKEEVLRYSVPDRAFSYTAADGRKSTVAPLRRGGGKPTSKARDHFMLKIDRPPHVTILCLVRDAAARLPGSIGTRADVCTLIRDSQYVVESVADVQVNQVVSGALDRLHYERDPCVQFDGDKKLWVYLHREREEEDFEDDGTASTKKWKRQRKDPIDQSDPAAVTVTFNETGEQIAVGSVAGYEPDSDLNVEPSSLHGDDRTEPVHNDLRSSAVELTNTPFVGSGQSSVLLQGQPVGWNILALNPLRENNMLCQENSTNEDFDDDTFSRERPVGLVSASLL